MKCWTIVRWHQNNLLRKWHFGEEEKLLIETLWLAYITSYGDHVQTKNVQPQVLRVSLESNIQINQLSLLSNIYINIFYFLG